MPQTFADVYDLYRRVNADPTFAGLSLKEFSSLANNTTGTSEYEAGLSSFVPSQIKRGSYWLDKALNATGVPEIVGSGGEQLFGALGANPATGREVGHGLLRTAVDFLPMTIGSIVAPEAVIPALIASGALGAANAYEKTDSGAAAAIGGVTPALGMFGANLAGRALSQTLLPRLGQMFPAITKVGLGTGRFGAQALTESGDVVRPFVLNSLADRIANMVGSQAGATVAMEAPGLLTGDWKKWIEDPWTSAVSATVGNLPFMGHDLYSTFKGPKTIAVERVGTTAPATVPQTSVQQARVTPEDNQRALRAIEYDKRLSEIAKDSNVESRQRRQQELDVEFGFADEEIPNVQLAASQKLGNVQVEDATNNARRAEIEQQLGYALDPKITSDDIGRLPFVASAFGFNDPKTMPKSVEEAVSRGVLAFKAQDAYQKAKAAGPQQQAAFEKAILDRVNELKRLDIQLKNKQFEQARAKEQAAATPEQVSADELRQRVIDAFGFEDKTKAPKTFDEAAQRAVDVFGMRERYEAAPPDTKQAMENFLLRKAAEMRNLHQEAKEREQAQAVKDTPLFSEVRNVEDPETLSTKRIDDLAKVNVVMQDANMPLVTNDTIRVKVERNIDKGDTLAQAESKATSEPLTKARKVEKRPVGRPSGPTKKTVNEVMPVYAEWVDRANAGDSEAIRAINAFTRFMTKADAELRTKKNFADTMYGVFRHWRNIFYGDPAVEGSKPLTVAEPQRLAALGNLLNNAKKRFGSSEIILDTLKDAAGRTRKWGSKEHPEALEIIRQKNEHADDPNAPGVWKIRAANEKGGKPQWKIQLIAKEGLTESLDNEATRNQLELAADKLVPVEPGKEGVDPDLADATEAVLEDAIDSLSQMDDGRLIELAVEAASRSAKEKLGVAPYEVGLRNRFTNDIAAGRKSAVVAFLANLMRTKGPHVGAMGERFDRIMASADLAYTMVPFDAARNMLGKHTLPKNGEIDVKSFKKMAGLFGELKDAELEFYRQIVPEAFKDDKVNVRTLAYGLLESGPQVETHVYGQEGQVSKEKEELDKLTHNFYDTLSVQDQIALANAASLDPAVTNPRYPENKENIERVIKLKEKFGDVVGVYIGLRKKQNQGEFQDNGPRATSYYNQISPFDTKKYPVVRVDVVLPEKHIPFEEYWKQLGFDSPTSYQGKQLTAEQQASLRKDYETKYGFDKKSTLWSPDNLHENLPNTLGWAMVQIVPHPVTGEKVMFVGEAQSRWGQEKQKERLIWKDALIKETAPGSGNWYVRRSDGKGKTGFASEAEAMAYINGHSLLPIHQSLILKAVIKEAQKQGISKVAVSDGETAMMTEGHDLHTKEDIISEEVVGNFSNVSGELGRSRMLRILGEIPESGIDPRNGNEILIKKNGDRVSLNYDSKSKEWILKKLITQKSRPSQEGGMRLHYDTTLPSEMRRLTGDKGEKVEMGVHKNAKQGVVHTEPAERRLFATSEEARQYLIQQTGDDTTGSIRAVGNQFEVAIPQIGSPVFRNPDGTPKSSVTGLSFSLANLHPRVDTLLGRGGERLMSRSLNEHLDLRPDFDTVWDRVLEKNGFTGDQRLAAAEFRNAVKKMANLDLVSWGEIVNDLPGKGKDVLGLASLGEGAMKAWMGASEMVRKEPKLAQVYGMAFVGAHEAAHLTRKMFELGLLGKEGNEAFKAMDRFARETSGDGLTESLRLLAEGMLPKEMLRSQVIQEMLRVKDPEEFLANSQALWALGQVKPGADAGMVAALAEHGPRAWMETIANFARSLWGAAKGALMLFRDKSDGGAVKVSKDLVENLTRLRKSINEAKENIAAFQSYFDVDASSFKNLRSSALRVMNDHTVTLGERELAKLATFGRPKEWMKDKVSETLRFLSEAFMPMEQLAEMHKPIAPFVDAYLKTPERMKQFLTRVMAPLHGGFDPASAEFTFKGEAAKDYKIVVEGNANRAFSAIQLWKQKQMMLPRDKRQVFDYQNLPPEVRPLMESLSAREQTAVKNMVARSKESMKILQGEVLNFVRERDNSMLATYLGRHVQDYREAPMLADMLRNAVAMDVTQAAQANAIIGQVASKIGNLKVLTNVIQKARQGEEHVKSLQEFFADREDFATVRSFGKWFVKAVDASGREVSNNSFGSKKEAELWMKEQRSKGATDFQWKKKSNAQKIRLDDDLIDAVTKVESDLRMRMRELIDDPQVLEQLDENIDLLGELKSGEIAKSFYEKGSMRRLAPGAEDLNLLLAQEAYIGALARKLSIGTMKARSVYELNDPALKGHEHLVEQVRGSMDNFVAEDSPIARAVTHANAVYFLGGNLVSHIVELAQPLFTVWPQMKAEGVSAIKGAKMLKGVIGDILNFYVTGKGDLNNWKDVGERKMLQSAAEKGLIGMGHIAEVQDSNVTSAIDARFVAEKSALAKAGEKALWPIKKWAELSMDFYKLFTKHNAKISLLLGYRMGQLKGLDRLSSEANAERFARVTTGNTGRAGRPWLPYKGGNAFGPIALSLQRYTMMTASMLGRYVKHSMNGREMGLSAKEVSDARGALAMMLGVQFAAGGALGLPFLGAAATLLQNLAGVDVKGSFYEQLGQLLDDDKESGGMLGDIVMRGAANAMLDRLGLPVDVASRFTLGGLPGMSEMTGISSDSIWGATGSLIRSAATGVQALAQDRDLKGFVKSVAPPGLRKAIDLWANGDATTASGKPLGLHDDEKLAYALGIQSSRIRKLRDFETYQKANEENRRANTNRTVAQIVDAYERDPVEARMRLDALLREGNNVEKHKEIVRAVTEKLVEKQFGPADPRKMSTREGAMEAMNLMRGMNLPLDQPNEVERLKARMGMMRQLGVNPAALSRQMPDLMQFEQRVKRDPFSAFKI